MEKFVASPLLISVSIIRGIFFMIMLVHFMSLPRRVFTIDIISNFYRNDIRYGLLANRRYHCANPPKVLVGALSDGITKDPDS